MARMPVNKILALAGIALIVLSVVNFVAQMQTISRGSGIYDKKLIPALKNISVLVPPGAVMVVSTQGPYVTYFTGHITKVPWGVSSKESLVEYMTKNHYDYLVVFQGSSEEPKLKSLFSSQQVRTLETSFQLMGIFKTDSFSTIYLFKLRDSG